MTSPWPGLQAQVRVAPAGLVCGEAGASVRAYLREVQATDLDISPDSNDGYPRPSASRVPGTSPTLPLRMRLPTCGMPPAGQVTLRHAFHNTGVR
jgi:hypothetical protein